MILFETARLIIKSLEEKDEASFIELLSDPEIITPIPQVTFSKNKIIEMFQKNLSLENVLDQPRSAWGIFEKGKQEMIGLSLFLTNEENEKELGYRFKVKFWGKGYGTEITKAMLDYYFYKLNINKVTAEVAIANVGSVKILDKFMNPVKEFYNEKEQCMDRWYEIHRTEWKQKKDSFK